MARTTLELGIAKLAALTGGASQQMYDTFVKNLGVDFANYGIEVPYGMVWSRPGLPDKIRAFITVAGLIALSRPMALKSHLGIALNLGITPDELREVIFHMSVYAGQPAAAESMYVLNALIEERTLASNAGSTTTKD